VKIAISRTADQDLMAGFRFYKFKGLEVAHYFLDSLISDIDSLVLYAGIHRKVDGFHVMLSRRFPFAVYYKIEHNIVRIRRVLDCRRDPEWIKKALKRG
jgi:plasmid stabilization system protein ParE